MWSRLGNCRMRRIYETVKFTLCKLLAKIINVPSTHPTFGSFMFLTHFSLHSYQSWMPSQPNQHFYPWLDLIPFSLHSSKSRVHFLTAQAFQLSSLSFCCGVKAILTCFSLVFMKGFGWNIAGKQLPPQHVQSLLANDAVRKLPRRRDPARIAGWHR